MAINLLTITDPARLEARAHHDGDGLYLDVRSATSASWVFKFTFGGKRDEVGLGSRKKVDAERARELRCWCLAELGAGRNPKVTLKGQKLELIRLVNAAPALSVYETAKQNVALIAKKAKSEKVRKTWVRSLHKDFIGYVADMQPHEVRAEDVEPLLKRLYAATPVQADDIRQRLAKVLSWSKATDKAGRFERGWENPVRWEDNLEHTLERGDHKVTHHKGVPFAEVGKFLADLREREENGAAMRLALEWHVISATRIGETTAADWSEFDWANDCWVIPAARMKMRRPHRVPLTARHHAILDLILGGKDAPEAGPVFTLNGVDAVSVTGVRKVMQGVRNDGVTLHGFRSAFSTWGRATTQHPERDLEGCLAHVVGGDVRNAYIADDFLELRRPIMEAWAAYCGVVQADKVVAFRRRAA